MKNNLKLGLGLIAIVGLSACVPEQAVRKDNTLQSIVSQEAKLEKKKAICQWFQGRENLVLKEYANDTLGNELEDGNITVYSLDRTPVIASHYSKGAGISTANLAEGKYTVVYNSGNDVYMTKFVLDRGMR